MSEHTKEPWKIGSSPAGKSVVFLVGDEPDHTLGPDKNWIDCNTEANARRIVACVNAMAGIGDDNVLFRRGSIGTVRKHIVTQQVQIEKLTSQRDQLLAALEAVRNSGDWYTSAIELNMDIDGNELLAVVDKAIAAVKGD